ncbi:beta strand repeat-containing protein [Cyanobium sp. ATX-6F1]|uniref:beta strand repeat-containing protein n=1 Tax=Cyanobium sp. ATX-6F1 TaxID=3137388 RepID=UPI0039BDBAD8
MVAPDTFFVNGPGASLVGTPPVTANVVAQKVRIVPEPLYPLVAPGLNFADAGDASVTISPSQIAAITNTGTALVLQASNDILLRPLSDLTFNNPRGNGGDLTLQAGRNIALNSSISTDNGNLTLIANDPGAIPGVREPGDGGIVQRTGTSLNAGTGTVTLAVRPSTATATAGTIALSQVSAGAIDISAVNLSLSGTTLSANGSPTAAGSLSVTSTGVLSVANSTFNASSPTGDGGSITLDGTVLQIGGSTFNAFGTGSGNGGTIALGALSTPFVPTSLSLTSSLLDARGGTAVLPLPLSNGGTITVDGGAIALAGATLNTSGGATGGTIAIGMAATNNPTSVSIVNSNLIADPAATGGSIAVGGTTIFTSGSLYNVFGASGGFLALGSPLTNALIFGAGTSVLGGGSGSFHLPGHHDL